MNVLMIFIVYVFDGFHVCFNKVVLFTYSNIYDFRFDIYVWSNIYDFRFNFWPNIYDFIFENIGFKYNFFHIKRFKIQYICLFSCYNNPQTANIRKLKIKNKVTNETSEIELNHYSIVLFSLESNSKHLHKIVLDNPTINNDEWLGITFRLSKTFIKFINEIAYFNNTYIILKLASKEESKEFYKCRSFENKSIEYKWSDDIFYTINPSDLLIIL